MSNVLVATQCECPDCANRLLDKIGLARCEVLNRKCKRCRTCDKTLYLKEGTPKCEQFKEVVQNG